MVSRFACLFACEARWLATSSPEPVSWRDQHNRHPTRQAWVVELIEDPADYDASR